MLQGSGRSPRKRRRRCGRQAAIARAFAGIKTMQLIEQLNPSFFSALHSSQFQRLTARPMNGGSKLLSRSFDTTR
jgi:hypothetical protein